MIRIIEHLCFQWPTSDDWYPCFPRNTVRVRCTTIRHDASAIVRLSVWGADDTGMERDLPESVEALARQLHLAEHLPNPLTRDWLTAQGFVPA